MLLGARERAAIDRLEAVVRAHIAAPPSDAGIVEASSRAHLCPEIDCLRGWLSPDTIVAAERRALALGVGADRVLINAGLLDDDIYLRILGDALGIPFEPLDTIPRESCKFDDEELLNAPATGLLPLNLDNEFTIVIAPQGLAARRITELISNNPVLARRFRFTTTECLRSFVTRHIEQTWIDHATHALAKAWPALSASPSRRRLPSVPLLTAGGVLLAAFVAAPTLVKLVSGLMLTLTFAAWITLRIVGTMMSRSSQSRLAHPADRLPTYTVLAPLYREAGAVKGLVAALRRIDYPPEKLDIKLIVEPDDVETRQAIDQLRLSTPFEVVVAPRCEPRTKPKALNAVLPFARGTFTVVYDAEDRPEPDQLRRALDTFAACGSTVACVQASLTIDNSADNWLTAMFTAEYAGQFDVFLPALTQLQMPLPLGGSSNHFRTAVLRQVGAWDAYNVTEDADLGLRLARFGYRSIAIDSTTYEEAPARLGLWLRQRTRWFKGWMQTWLVHMRQPRRLQQDLGLGGFLVAQLIVGGNVLASLVHPLLIVGLTDTLVERTHILGGSPISALFGATIIAGYLVSILLGVVGLWRRGLLQHCWALLLMPAHWLLLSVAAWRALYQLLVDPYRWEKTDHGLARTSRTGRHPADNIITGLLKPPRSRQRSPAWAKSRLHGTIIEKLTALENV